MVTVVGILLVDLLVGIALGMVVAIVVILFENYRLPFQVSNVSQQRGERVRIVLGQQVTFLNKASVLQTLDSIPNDSSVEIDASETVFVHLDVIEIINNFVLGARAKGIEVFVNGLDISHQQANVPVSMEIAVTPPATSPEKPKK